MRTIIMLCITLLLAGCAGPMFPGLDTAEQRIQVVDAVEHAVLNDFPFFEDRFGDISRDEFLQAAEELREAAEGFLPKLIQLSALLQDGHTGIRVYPFGVYPGIHLRYFTDGDDFGVFIEELSQRRIEEGYLQVGDIILAVKDLGAEADDPQWQNSHDLLSLTRSYISASSEAARNQFAAGHLIHAALRDRSDEDAGAEIMFRIQRNGNVIERTVSPGVREDYLLRPSVPYRRELTYAGRMFSYILIPTMGYLDDIDRIDRLINESLGSDGIILDLRGNGGGHSAVGDYLTARFALTKEFRFSIVNGVTKKNVRNIGPVKSRGEQYAGPVVLLTDHHVFSAANHFVSLCAYANEIDAREHSFRIIGGRTGGGSGIPEVIRLTPKISLRLSRDVIVNPEGKTYERGIEPDINVLDGLGPGDYGPLRPMLKDQFAGVDDMVIHKALQVLAGEM